MKIQLSIIEGQAKGKQFEFDQADRFLVGRSHQSHFQLSQDDLYVSRNHFLLELRPPYCYIRDNKSTNGTFVKGRDDEEFKSITEARLHDGDLIKIGKTVLKVNVVKEEVAAPSEKFFCIRCGSDISDVLEDKEPAELNVSDFICQKCERKKVAKIKPAPISRIYQCAGCNRDVSHTANKDGRAEELSDIALYLCDDCASREQKEVDIQKIKDYRILRELGRGGMGVVYKAWHKPTGRLVALKKILPEVAMDNKTNKLFQREMAVMSDLIHPNIVRLIDQGMIGKEHYFVAEYLPEGDVDRLVTKVYNGSVPIKEAGDIICQTLEGLEYAHQKGFIHRDIKPQNILLAKNRRGDMVAKISDFGLSKSYEKAGQSGMTKPGESGGSPLFMAPEQFTNYRFVKPPADVYSVGVTLYYLLTARYQFRFPTPHDLLKGLLKGEKPKDPILIILEDPPIPIRKQNPNIPEDLAKVVDKAIRKNVRERFQTARELKEAILRQ